MGQYAPMSNSTIDEGEYYLLLTCLKLAAGRLAKEQVLELADMLFDELRDRRAGSSERLQVETS